MTEFASDRQVRFIVDLIDKRDWQNSRQAKYISRVAVLNIAFGWVLGYMETFLDEINDQINSHSTVGENANAVLALLASNGTDEFQFAYASLDSKGASALIEWLLTMPAKPVPTEDPNPVQAKVETVDLEDGIYRNVKGEIFKVYHTQKGHQVAKIARIEQHHADETAGTVWTVEFEYVGKAPLRGLKASDKLTIEQARDFGMIYGACVCCARTLTDELSIALGIGPVCGKREFGGEYKLMVQNMKLDLECKAANA
jgi:hypothetical protein